MTQYEVKIYVSSYDNRELGKYPKLVTKFKSDSLRKAKNRSKNLVKELLGTKGDFFDLNALEWYKWTRLDHEIDGKMVNCTETQTHEFTRRSKNPWGETKFYAAVYLFWNSEENAR